MRGEAFRHAVRRLHAAARPAADGRPGASFELRATMNASIHVLEAFEGIPESGRQSHQRLLRACRDWLAGNGSRQLAEDIWRGAGWFVDRYN